MSELKHIKWFNITPHKYQSFSSSSIIQPAIDYNIQGLIRIKIDELLQKQEYPRKLIFPCHLIRGNCINITDYRPILGVNLIVECLKDDVCLLLRNKYRTDLFLILENKFHNPKTITIGQLLVHNYEYIVPIKY